MTTAPTELLPVAFTDALGSTPPGDIGAALDLAVTCADVLPLPGEGATKDLWEALTALGRHDLTTARVVEPHLDARNILAEARQGGVSPAARSDDWRWGVFAAEGPGTRLTASVLGGRWELSGRKPWCSLGDRLERGLVTAWVDDRRRGLFAVDLRHEGVGLPPSSWAARGLRAVNSGPLDFDGVPAEPVGDPGWYLRRPGFGWGGIGVAAVWLGGALALSEYLRPRPGGREPDQIALWHLGRIDVALHAARAVLDASAIQIDEGRAVGDDGALLASRVRAVVAQSAELVLEATAHGLGPGPLVADERYAAATADLHLYLRQWHAERDLAGIGSALLADGGT